jgi:multidrug efflux pump subunit AcrA (membrane-fusion protein)
MHAQCEVIAGDEIRGPTIPASFVRERNGSRFLAVDGVFREVEGFFTQGLFVLQDPSLLGRRVEMEGTWPKPGRSPGDSTNSGRFRASGELMPAGSADVVVKRILRWLKVQWIIPEDTEVKEGDVVARLEENETSEELRRWESRLSEAESNRKTQEEQTALTAREGAFQLAKESNVLEIARLDTVIADEGRDWPGIFKAELERDEARIRLDETSNRLDRVRRRTETSPVELGRIERDRRRAELQLEAADLRLAKLRRGARPVDRLKAEADFTEQRLKVDTLTRKVETDNFRSACELTRARRRETHVRNRFKERQRWMENLTLRAPRGGIARYTKIWNSGVFSKVNVGGVVGQHFVLMKIADVSRMYLKVEIPERYFNRIRKGLRVEVEVPSTANVRLGGVVSDIEFLFEDKRLKDTKVGLYSSQETLGETVFHVHVEVDDDPDRKLKPGTMATVCFPFDA